MKNMKSNGAKTRRICAIALVAVMWFSMTACDDEDGNGGGGASALSGTWNKSDGCQFVFNGSTFTFFISGFTTYSGSFSVSGSTITFDITGAPAKATCKYQLSGDTLTISNFSWDDGFVNGTYTKGGGSANNPGNGNNGGNNPGSGNNGGNNTGNGSGSGTPSNSGTQGLQFTLWNNDTEYQVSKGTAKDANIEIPSTYNGKPVTRIAAGTRTVPSGGTIIYSGSFTNITTPTTITIPDSVRIINACAFADSTGITSITIPDSVKEIAVEAFDRSGIYKNSPANSVVYADKWAVSYKGSLGELTIKSDTVGIANQSLCFYENRNNGIPSVVIPASVKYIGLGAFESCSNLTSVTFQGTIASSGFSNSTTHPVFKGDLRAKFYASNTDNGTPGTYTTASGPSSSSVWTKQ